MSGWLGATPFCTNSPRCPGNWPPPSSTQMDRSPGHSGQCWTPATLVFSVPTPLQELGDTTGLGLRPVTWWPSQARRENRRAFQCSLKIPAASIDGPFFSFALNPEQQAWDLSPCQNALAVHTRPMRLSDMLLQVWTAFSLSVHSQLDLRSVSASWPWGVVLVRGDSLMQGRPAVSLRPQLDFLWKNIQKCIAG